ncbi:FAD-dependent urate hydroxylase [Weizmannia acidilactici]|uniref:FAD-dependent urate hydroxylase n=1 Tax=Weizmannia acidilactici TaxID=2607726 RepID=A0A5J4JDK1_9BACI|nr:NAD(P)/FAD-dependent oxidoreductase [Weizmannia acidilactici]GER67599.1 FAD-dependent urate hydroxylase [Weizmannia acidilactici]GER69821.1 FAD-dependent urate hydroxylase [Weizmannia acidilactici]GER73685.1 FAD-dependent urate hydroxylase [Weizmannia acidilactici]
MSLEALNERVHKDLSCLAFGGPDWVRPFSHPEGHVYDVVIVGGGQCGLGAAFGLLRERISNILVIDENLEGYEGPWDTYARMLTLRTPKHLTSIDFGIPSLTFRAWWEAQYGEKAWDDLDKIPRGEWMNYLRWYRKVLRLPVLNQVTLKLIEPEKGIHRLHIGGEGAPSSFLLARKVVLATGIQGGGEWHVPRMIKEKLPSYLYAHTSQTMDMERLRGRKIGILGGGASAFDNANYVLSEGAAEAHVFIRSDDLKRINPIRQMEVSGMIERYHALSDHDKYAVMAHFFKYNQPPTNDIFNRASAWPGFRLHTGSPWLDVKAEGGGAVVTTPHGDFQFDFLILATGLVSDPSLRPELRLVEPYIARWGDRYRAPEDIANLLIDAHPYLGPDFAFVGRDERGEHRLHGLFAFNYSALISCGLSASALSGLRFALPKLVQGIADQLFLDDRAEILKDYFAYREIEFTGKWPGTENAVFFASAENS